MTLTKLFCSVNCCPKTSSVGSVQPINTNTYVNSYSNLSVSLRTRSISPIWFSDRYRSNVEFGVSNAKWINVSRYNDQSI